MKSGFIVIIGRSNVGKSTLLNALVGSKIAITTPKPQTTRMPIQGIVTSEKGQAVFIDTPGILKGAKDALSKKLADLVKQSLRDIDVIAYIVDPTREIGQEEREVMRLIEVIDKPRILVINKCDLNKKPFIEFYKDLSGNYTSTIEVSALRGTNVKGLMDLLFNLLPEGEAMYPEHQLTNMPSKMWIAELIREKLFLRLQQEVPYSVHVEVEELEERENGMMYIRAIIYTHAERYKSMIIGAGGRGVREIGQSARKELEGAMQTKVFLDLTVDVDPHWMNKFE